MARASRPWLYARGTLPQEHAQDARATITLKSKFILGFALLAISVLVCFQPRSAKTSSFSGATRTRDGAFEIARKERRPDLRQLRARLPLSFERNLGQQDERSKFSARAANYNLFLTATGAVIQLRDSKAGLDKNQRASTLSDSPKAVTSHSVISLKLQGANTKAFVSGVDELPGRRNYFIGNDPRKWRRDVPTFRAVRYEQIYPGINLTYYGNQQQLEYDFEIAPGTDPRTIRMAFDSGVRPILSPAGELVLRTSGGELRQDQPVVYQDIDGRRELIKARYVLVGKRQAEFEVGSYDRTKPLIIDPTLVYSTYLGGGGDDLGSTIAVDGNNNVYIAGTTSSTNFPLSNAAFGSNAGLSDIFVTKIDAAGANIIYSTYVGGSGIDRASGIAVDNNGNAYVVGRVDASSINFPTTPGSLAPSYRGGDFDGVVLKLNGQGNSLVYSTFLGAEENDSTEAVAVDSQGNAYVTGGTKSSGFPTTLNAYQGSRAGDTDAYISKINPAGSSLLYSTFLGGGGTDRGSGIVIDSNGRAYLAGFTSSADFPTENAFQNAFGGSFDAFLATFDTNASGVSSLIFCSYLGGAADDKAYGIALDSGANNIYVVGQSSSNNFPVLNAAQPAPGGAFDAFVAKISSAGSKVYATYLGGSADDRALGIAVNSSGEAYVTGFTSSSNFPTVNSLQSTRGGGNDAFVTKFNAAGSSFAYSTYLGGSNNESSQSTVTATNPIALDSLSNAYITGYTASNNFPTAAPLQAANAGGASDAFVVKISDTGVPPDFSVAISPSKRLIVPGDTTNYDVTVTPSGGFLGLVNLSISGLPANSSANFNPPSLSINGPAPATSTLTITSTATTPLGQSQLMITGTSGSVQHSSNAGLNIASPTSADLSVVMTASPNPPLVGFDLTYRLVVGNNGPAAATNVHVTDSLPLATFISASASQGTCTGTAPVDCDLGGLAQGASAVITVVVRPFTQGNISTTATVSSSQSDPEPNNNNATLMSFVQSPGSGPAMLDPNLSVQTVVTGLSQPTSMAFIGMNDFFVLEKDTGKVQRVVNGVVQSTVLDLAVNSASERGLLGLALHPYFKINRFVYLFWTESASGVDSTMLADVPLLGNRVDRYFWNGSTLNFDRNLIKLRAYQADANQPLRGNHNGGILRFGPDGKLYILMGDNGRRGLLQNVTSGAPVPDDQFGGPEPDDAHLTGFILRLNDDGSTPNDNPFYNASTNFTGEAAANIRKLYAYGVRNGFGMGIDPLSGNLWDQENGDDAFDEMNRVAAGSNNGWVQVMGPSNRVSQFKEIETTYGVGTLQQLRWPPSLIADTPAAALARLYMLPGAHYNEPELSWKYAVAPSTLGFVPGRGLGPQFEGDMFVGAARTFLSGGYLFHLKLTPDRLHFSFSDSRLNDLVADNLDKFDIAESESLLIGKDFGITTGIEPGPNGNLFVISNTNGAVYEISGQQPKLFVAKLDGPQEVPPTNSTATGTATVLLSPDEKSARVSLNFTGLSSSQTAAHIHGPAAPGTTAPVIFPLSNGNVTDFLITPTTADVQNLKDGLLYINVHSNNFPSGEIRGQLKSTGSGNSFQFSSESYLVSESAGALTIAVTRLGDVSQAGTVEVSTGGGTASAKTDYTPVSKAIQFASGEALKTFTLPIIDNVYVQGNRTVNVSLFNPSSGAFLGSPSTSTVTIFDNDTGSPSTNPLDDAQFFVNQHYLDFLGRNPDLGGFTYWTNKITACGSNTACINAERIGVSAAFFMEQEFQQTGSFVYRMYRGALGRDPSYAEFVKDRGKLVGGTNLQSNRNTLLFDFVRRPEFLTKYGGADFVGTLLITAHDASGADLTPLESNLRATYANCVQTVPPGFPLCEARAVETVADYPAFSSAVYNRSFVLTEYFGYLRRDADPSGYNFWLDVLNNRDPNNYLGMVCSFITSAEYQRRFSSVVTHANAECAGVH